MSKKIAKTISLFLFLPLIGISLLPVSMSTSESSWHIETLSIENADGPSSMVVDSSGSPHIAYFDSSSWDIKYVWFDGVKWNISVIGKGGPFLSLTLDSKGNPHIAYTGSHLFYASWDGNKWNIEEVGDASDVLFTSLNLDSSGNPHICYSYIQSDEPHNIVIKYVVFEDNNWSTETIDKEKSIGNVPMALDKEGNPHICYWFENNTSSGLKYLWFDGSWHIETIREDVGDYSMTLDENGNPHISYSGDPDKDLKYLWFDGEEWHKEIVDAKGEVGMRNSIALDSFGNPHIAYFDSSNLNIKYAWFDGNNWHIEIVDREANTEKYPFIAMVLDKNDNPHITYTDYTNHSLKYATYSEPVQTSSKPAIGLNQSLIISVSLVSIIIVAVGISIWYRKKRRLIKQETKENKVKPKNENK